MPDHPPTIPHALVSWCEQTPEHPCLQVEATTLSYSQLWAAAARVAGGLLALGLARGERVALFLEAGLPFLAGYLGTHLAGGVVVLVNTQYRQVELRHILADSAARGCLTDAARRAELALVEPELPALGWVVQAGGSPHNVLDFNQLLQHNMPVATPGQVQANDTALLAYTSGTTGRAKGAMLSHGNLASNSAAVCRAWGWGPVDRLLLTLPLFHIHGLGVGVNGSLMAGGSIELSPRFDAPAVLDRLVHHPPTMFFGVPTMYARLIQQANQLLASGLAQPPLAAGVRLFVSGSAALSPQTFAEFQALFGQPILERYGMTETIMNLTNPLIGERRPGSVGVPFPGQEARIVDLETRQPQPVGVTGEIQVRGPHVFQGYWQQPDATAAAFDQDGWFNTGDLGWRSADGYYTIVGRAKELIISGGYNIYPRELEEVLAACPGVAEVAVFGAPDAELGEQVVAAVVPVMGAQLDAADLVAFCRERLASYKKPRRVLFVDALPRNALGKVQKHRLLAVLE